MKKWQKVLLFVFLVLVAIFIAFSIWAWVKGYSNPIDLFKSWSKNGSKLPSTDEIKATATLLLRI